MKVGAQDFGAFAGGLLLAALLSPFALERLVRAGLPADSDLPQGQIFLVLAAMSIVLELVLAAGFAFRGWKALAAGVLTGVALVVLLVLL